MPRPILVALFALLGGCTIPTPGPAALSRIVVGADPVTGAPVATVAGCPDWHRGSAEDFSNRDLANFGCADAANFVAQLADPRDLVPGRGRSGGADAGHAVGAVDRYRTGKTTPLARGGTQGAATAPGPGE